MFIDVFNFVVKIFVSKIIKDLMASQIDTNTVFIYKKIINVVCTNDIK